MEPIKLVKAQQYVVMANEMIDDVVPFKLPSWEEIQAARAAFEALPAGERARILAEREAEEAQRQAVREAERCPRCGCHPDEHGDY